MKRLLLVSLGLISVGLYAGCLPENSTTSGTAGTSGSGTAGTNGPGTAGTDGSGTAGTQGGTAGTQGGTAGTQGGTAGTQGGTAGTQGGTAGTQGGTAGTQGGTAGTQGGTAGTQGGTAGRGGNTGTAGTNSMAGRGGTGVAGTNGMAGRGGTTGTAGTSAAGTTGTGGATGNVVCDSIKQQLDGFQFLLACGATQSYSPLVCVNPAGNCPGGTEYLVRGHQNTDRKLTVAGTSSQSCTITLHVQGVVEPKHYNRCTTYFGAATEGFAQGPANGGATSGCYPSTSGDYNVYMMHVSDNTTLLGTTLTGNRYYWNAINQSEAHFSYRIDYTTPAITIKGGSTLWMLANDSNCSAIKNCSNTSQDGTTATSGRCDAITVANLTTAPGPAITQPYNGQFISFHVTSAQ